MKDKHIPLGKITGIPIYIDYSWFLLFILLTWMLAQGYFPREFKNWSPVIYWADATITSLLFFLSIILHELGHSIVARKYKVQVKRITLFIFGGVAEISKEPPKSSAEFWIAIAGPVVSFMLAAVFYFLDKLSAGSSYLTASFRYLGYINFILAFFNLIPGFPLDGGRVLRAIVWKITNNFKKATTIAANTGRFFGFLFIMLGVLQVFQNNIADGLWIAFIGWFLESAAVSQIQSQALTDLLFGHKVNEAITTDFGIVYPDTTIDEIIDNHFIGANRRSLLVKDDDKVIGFITPSHLHSISTNNRQTATVKDIMIPVTDAVKLNSNTSLIDALKTINENEIVDIPVTDNGKYVGILNRDSLTQFILRLHSLGH